MRTAAFVVVLCVSLDAYAESRVQKAQALLAAKDCDQLLLSFENARAGSTDDLDLARSLSQAASGACSADKVVAFSLASAARRLAPKDPDVLLVAASAALAAGQPGDAAAALDAAIATAPADARPRLARAELALQEGEPPVAVSVLAPLKSDPKAKELLDKADAAARGAVAAKKRMATTEKAALEAASKAKALDQRTSAPDEGAGPGAPVATSSERVGSGSFAFDGEGHRTYTLAVTKGRTYRVHAGGWCHRHDGDTTPRSLRLSGTDLRIQIGSMVHGFTASDDFDFIAETDGAVADVWNAHMDAGKSHCGGAFSVTER